MKKILGFLAILILLVGCSRVPAGHVGVKVYLLGGEKGVDHEVLGTGRYHIGINEELYLFPTFKQNYVWTKDKSEGSPNDESITFQTLEGMTVGADVGITYLLANDQISNIFEKYRRGVEEITDTFLRNEVRNTFNMIASRYPVESVYGKGKSELLKEVNVLVKKNMLDQGIIVEQIYLIGEFRLPANVVEALNKKIQATQKAMQAEFELRETEAEAKKVVAKARGQAESKIIQAEAEAKANQAKLSTITNALIAYEKVQNEKAAINKWNGQLPTHTSGIPLIETLK